MADDDRSDKSEKPEKPQKPKAGELLISLFLLSALAIGVGWFVAGMHNRSPSVGASDQANANAAQHAEDVKPHSEEDVSTTHSGKKFAKLDPIIVDLSGDTKTWLRLELAVIADATIEVSDPEIKAQITGDIAAYIRTATLAQISGPTGYMHFREDILDRARLSTQGKIEKIYVQVMVVE